MAEKNPAGPRKPRASKPPVEQPSDAAEMAAMNERLLDENADLRKLMEDLDQKCKLLYGELDAKAIGRGESDGIINRLTKQRNQATKDLGLAVDTLRSASISAHKAEHKGAYDKCGHALCRYSRELWENMSEGFGVGLASLNPDEYWNLTDEANLLAAVPPPVSGGTGPAPVAPIETIEEAPEAMEEVDPELAELHPGKTFRKLRVPAPDAEKDPSDPGLPKVRKDAVFE